MGFTKLDEGILMSSIMAEPPDIFKVWIALLASCKEDGISRVSTIGLSSHCFLPLETIKKAIERLESPDLESRSINDDGRRIRRVDGGFEIINYFKYRELSTKESEAKRKYESRHKEEVSGLVRTNPDSSASASASSSASSSASLKSPEKLSLKIPDHLVEIWPDFLAMRRAIRKPATERAQRNLFRDLEKFYPGDINLQIVSVEQSITNSWQGVFKIREDFKGKEKQPYDREARRKEMESWNYGEKTV